ncbi:MAG: YlxR family protein [Deltaproteobacteria bacterium]|nr:YlxR family protein [Deltaproteobacteria bacterium]
MSPRVAHIPFRTCLGCRDKKDKAGLIRMVLDPSGSRRVLADGPARLPGRGGYICPSPQCYDRAVKRKAFHRAWKQTVIIPSWDEIINSTRP